MEEKKSNNFLIVLVILLSVLVLALAGTVVVMMLNNKKDKPVASNTTTTVETTKEGDSTTTSTTTSHPGVQGTQATYNPVEGNLYSYDEFWPLEMSEVITKVELNKEYINDTNFKIELAFMEAHYTLKSDEYTKSGEEASGAIRYKRSEFEKLYKDIFKEDFNVKNLTSSDDYDDNYIYTSYPTGMGPEDKIFEFKQIGQTVGGEYIIQFYQVKEDDEFHINYLGPIAYLKFKTNGSSNKQFTSFIVKNK